MTRTAAVLGTVMRRAGPLVLGLAILVAGCGPSRPKPPAYSEPLDSDTVTMVDLGATTQLARQKEWTEEVNGFLKVHLILRNLGGDDLRLEIRTDFRDRTGATVDGQIMIWQPVAIDGHQDFTYTKLSPATSATQYHIFIRMAKDDH